MGKGNFILYLEHQAIFEMLTDEQAGQLIKAIFQYERSGEMPKMDKFINLAFIPIMQTLDKNRAKYENTCKKNQENINKRWKKEDTKNTTGKIGTQENTKNTDNDNEYDSDNDYDNDNNNDVVVSDSCVDGLQKVIDFYQENIGLITPYGIEVFTDYAKDMPEDLIIFAMQKSVESNKKTIQYIKAILNNWHKAGIKTLVDAKRESNVKNKIENQREYGDLSFLYANEKV